MHSSLADLIQAGFMTVIFFFLPGAGAAASWRAEPQAAPTSGAVEASSWLGYFATVPATVDGQWKQSV